MNQFTEEELAKLPKWARRKISSMKSEYDSMAALVEAGNTPLSNGRFYVDNHAGHVWLSRNLSVAVDLSHPLGSAPNHRSSIFLLVRKHEDKRLVLDVNGGRGFHVLPRASNSVWILPDRP